MLATAAALLLIVGVTAIALADQGPSTPPSIELDDAGPLFSLQGMQPGDPPSERCVALTARGGVATRLEVSGTVDGPLAQKLRMEVEGGTSPGPGPSHGCAGFAPEQTLWSGTLAEFPQEGAPAVSAGALADGQSRVFRFRVSLPADAAVSVNETASQTIRWRAELEAPGEPAPPAQGQGLTQPVTAPPCRGAIRCRGRLIVRMTPRGARLHARIHAPGDERIRRLTLMLPISRPTAGATVAVRSVRMRGTTAELTGAVRARPGARWRLLTIARLPARTHTVLMRVRLSPRDRAALRRAACRRDGATALLSTNAAPRRLAATMWIDPASCTGR